MTSRPLRILSIVPTLGAGGAERVLTTLSGIWSADGHQVMIATLGDQPNTAFAPGDAVEVHSLRVAGDSTGVWDAAVSNGRRLLAIGQLIEEWRPDVVLGFTTHASILAAFAGTRYGVPVIVTERNYPPLNPIGMAWSLLRRIAYRRASVIAMQTERAATWARAAFPAGKVVVVPNPLNTDLLQAPAASSRTLTVAFVGRLVEVKRPLDAIAGFAAAAPAPWRLQMIGDGPLREAGQSHAASLGVSERVDWLGVRGDVGDLLRRASIAVFTSASEGFPNGLLEAMAAGCAVVSTDCLAGPAELLQDGNAGLLVPVGDVAQIAAAIRTLVEAPALRESLGEAARARALQFAPPQVAEQWEAVLQRAVG